MNSQSGYSLSFHVFWSFIIGIIANRNVSVTTRKKLKDLSDEEIIDLIVNSGDPSLFEEIYDRYALKVFRKCISFTKDEAEAKDLAHDVLVKIYLGLSKFAGKSKLSTWIYSITYNYCVDHQAKKKKQLTLSEEISREKEDIDVQVHSDEEVMGISIDVLNGLLDLLSVAEKSILLMKYQDGFSVKEISALTDSGESAIKMKLKRTKAKLIKLYEESR